MSRNKRIVLGITGSIAAYKGVVLLRELQKRGFEVQVAMTEAALRFVTPLTLQTLSGKPVYWEAFPENPEEALAHIELVRDCDLLLIAPATANTIAKMAHGVADNLLTSLYLVNRSPVVAAPAMNSNMYLHPATRDNIENLRVRGVFFAEPEQGELACGDEGPGRLARIEAIADLVERVSALSRSMAGKRVVITAGPTREPIDSLRFLSNRSSGRMGYALSAEALRRGAQVELISGPCGLSAPEGVKLHKVETAREMKEGVEEALPGAHMLVMCAAVADYTPAAPVTGKLKKDGSSLSLELAPAPDILAALGGLSQKPVLVGFAAESGSLSERAAEKLKSKNLDLIIANHIRYAGDAQNQISIMDRKGGWTDFPLMAKERCAALIWDHLEKFLPP